MRLLSRLWNWFFPSPCVRGSHRVKHLERLRIERAGDKRFAAGAVLEQSLVCQDCGTEIVPWHDVAPPIDAIAIGVKLDVAEWHTIATGGKLFFLPDGADTFYEGVEDANVRTD